MKVKVDVDGIKQLRKQLRAVENGPKLSAVLAPIQPKVAQLISERSWANASSRQMQRAEASNRYRPNRSSVTVMIGGKDGDQAFAAGAQFGAKRYRQFPPSIPGGYTVFPAIDESRDEITELYLDHLASHIDPDTT